MSADFTSAASKGEIRTLGELQARAARLGLYLDESNMLHQAAEDIGCQPRGGIEEADEQEKLEKRYGS